MRKVVAIGMSNLTRFLRDRSNYFFAFLLPVGFIFVTGVAFGTQSKARIGVAGTGALAERIVAALQERDGLEVVRPKDERALRAGVERDDLVVGVALPAGLDDIVAGGDTALAAYYTASGAAGEGYRFAVMGAIESAAAEATAAAYLARRSAQPLAEALAEVEAAAARAPAVSMTPVAVDPGTPRMRYLGFGLVSASELVLFIFLTGLTSATSLIDSRKLGVARRMLASPTSPGVIVVGEGLGRFLVALFQGLYIVVASRLIFGVEWGDPLALAVLLIVFCAVSAGAGMLVGAAFSSSQQAAGVSVMLGLVLAALGGCMFPLDLFGKTMRAVANLTPHSWALEGFNALVRQSGDLATVLPQVGVLLGFAVALFALAAWRLRLALTRG